MSSRYSDDKRTHHHYRDEKDRHRSQYEHKHRSRSRSRSRSHSPVHRHGSSSSSSGGSNSRNIHHHHRDINSGRNGLSSVYGRNDEHKSRDADELICPPPPVISKVSMSIGKSNIPAKPVQLKLAPTKPSEPVKKLTVASAFSNNDSDDDEEEEVPVKYSRNIGRDTPTSSGPNSFGKTKQGFCDVKKIFEKSLREFNTE
ncbi:PEST proteolytic signal-containing nuclear protein-like [Contarinia nasturtii]|uniref:PEST proteolytic signal-containing nuclear protein-like n=1 Tax=Contarinia nasturtii TaxID=265458 RepID=UPI0012D37A15|nr:PEST proteolytic signal-containing nuclear protein-like [Contarinia nasturtii]